MARVVEPTADTLLGIEIFRNLAPEARAQIARYCRGSVYPARKDIVRHEDAVMERFVDGEG